MAARYYKAGKIYLRILSRLFQGIVSGKVRGEYAALLLEKNRIRQESLLISMFVTASCSVQCPHCIMGHLIRARKGYELSLEELRAFIDISERSGYVFEIMLTGGEPLLWSRLKEGLRMLRTSRMCAGISLFTNATCIDPLLDEEVVSFLDRIKVTQYRHNAANVAALCARYPRKVQVFHGEDFYVNPSAAVPNTLPARCLNEELFYFDRRMYACPHSASIAYGNGSKACISTPLEVGFLRGLRSVKRRQQKEICTYCISNEKVRVRSAKAANLGQGS